MQTDASGLPSPLGYAAGPGLADALRDFLAPAARAPGTPPEHKHWPHLARYLLQDCGFGAEPERWVALLCSRDFQAAWFREAAPHLPRVRVPLFFRALSRAVAAGEGATALATLRTGTPNPTAWTLPDAKGRWDREKAEAEFHPTGHDATAPADPHLEYENWFREFGRDMWYVMDAAGKPDVEAWLLSRSMLGRVSMFDERELEENSAAVPSVPGLGAAVAGWLREAGLRPNVAAEEAQRIAKVLERFGSYGEQAAAWVESTVAGRKLAARFDGRRLATAWRKSPSAPDMVTFALFDSKDVDVPKLKALAATLAARETRSEAEMRRFREEAGPERLAMMGKEAAAVAELQGYAAENLTEYGNSR